MARVLITGISGSIGQALAAHFLAAGDDVTGLDLVPPAASPPGQPAPHFVACDLGDGGSVRAALVDILEKSPPFGVIINNVGLIHNEPLVSLREGRMVAHDFETWDRVLRVTLSAAFYVTALCARKLVEQNQPGVVVNVSSICARGNAGQVAYSAAKAGINGMTASLAKELGPYGIRVAAIAPGYIDTPSTQRAVSESQLKRTVRNVPLGRLGKLDEVVQAVAFIVQNPYFDGKVLELDGGLTL